MSWFKAALFLHIIGALAFFAGLAIMWLGVWRLRHVRTRDNAWRAFQNMRSADTFFSVGSGLILLTGIYMGVRIGQHHKPTTWITIALVSFIAGSALGAIATKAIGKDLEHAEPKAEKLSASELARLQNPKSLTLFMASLGTAFGVLALMVFQPAAGNSILTVIVAALLGAALGAILGKSNPEQA